MSCKDVCVSMNVDFSNEFYRDEMRHARKPWRCCECGDPIVVGVLYEYAVGKCDGTIFENRTCVVCKEIRAEFTCGTWVFGDLWETIRDQMFYEWKHNELMVIDCLARLTSDEAIAKMRAEYADWRGEDE